MGRVPARAAVQLTRLRKAIPILLSADEFEQLVADALDGLPAELGRMMDNVAVVVEDGPTPEQLGDGGGTLLGLYEGVALTERSPLSYTGTMPDRITIFRGPICQLADNEAQLLDLVRTTVIHEVAHHFGISDDRLTELGWE
ncbi:MAG: metallopeptidase family protein [Actinomycetota bacterium]|nr:metallopeptidase family protein [Actinomycetota bacterium]